MASDRTTSRRRQTPPAAVPAAGAPAAIVGAVAARALGLLDLTSLNDDDTEAGIGALCVRACTPHGTVAAVCIYPRFVRLARTILAGSGVRVATVINFPAGDAAPAQVAEDTARAVDDGAQEIDVVWDYRAWLAGDRGRAQRVVIACRDAIAGRARLKVILETGAFAAAAQVGAACLDAVAAGADIVKTSTGKIAVGATPETVEAMLTALARHRLHHIGLKAAGGIRTTADAAAYLAMADRIMGADWVSPTRFRFGASGLLNDLLAVLAGRAAAGTPPTGGY